MSETFPPILQINQRVWTTSGYKDHGPLDGSKVDIAPNMGGVITASTVPYAGTLDGWDPHLYSIRWDNGQTSKHFANTLFCIGRFKTLAEFEDAVEFIAPIELTLGPQGGFKHAKLQVRFDGAELRNTVFDRKVWLEWLEPLARSRNVTVNTTTLPGKARRI